MQEPNHFKPYEPHRGPAVAASEQRGRLSRLVLIFGILAGFVIIAATRLGAQEESQLFPETGKKVSGKFLSYWRTQGGLARQGYPISDAMQEKSDLDGKVYTIQYFERAIFELHPENAPPNDVLLSLLGLFRYKQKYPNGVQTGVASQPLAQGNTVFFRETGKPLSGGFLDYWRANGGLSQFGYPLTGEFLEVSPLDGNSYVVQYFERAVFELHPENKPPYNILLSQLGTFRYEEKYLNKTGQPTATPHPPRPLYGIVGQGGLSEQINRPLLQEQYNAGVKMRFVQLGWDVLQPGGPTSWDSGIANAFQQRIDAFVATGSDTQLVLDLGIQYSPGWVSSIDPLVDQYGNVYQAGFPNGGVNVYWSPTVRQHVAAYIQRVFSTINFRGRLWAVRVGPYRGELLYPDGPGNEDNLSFWAFDDYAQSKSPVPGWEPGDESRDGEAEKFYYWYVDNLVDTFNFFLGEIRRYYSGYVAPVTPGAGMWQGNVSQLISRNLYDPSLQWYGTGNYWQRIFQMLPRGEANVINWCSSMGDGSGNDGSGNWWEWSSAKIQAYLAQQNGRRIYGENSAPNPYDTSGGADPRTTMQWIFRSLQDNNYLGLTWVSQSYMADSRYASLAQYQIMIAQLP